MPSEFDDDPFSRRADDLFSQLTQETDRLVDPLPAHRVRQLGDRRRTRRRVGAAAGTLAVAAVAATAALNLGPVQAPRTADPAAPATQPSTVRPSLAASAPAQVPVVTVTATVTPTVTDEPSAGNVPPASPTAGPTSSSPAEPTPSAAASAPTPSSPSTAGAGAGAPAAALTLDDLAGRDDLARAGSTAMYSAETVEPDGSNPQYPVSACEVDRTGLGQAAMLHRVVTGQGITTHVVGYQFATPEEATAARGTVRSWYSSCTARMKANGWSDVRITPATDAPVGSRAQRSAPTRATFRLVSGTSAGTSAFEEASLYQVGDRLEWVVTTLSNAQDDTFDTAAGGPVGTLYPGVEHSAAITDKLAPGS